MATRNTISTESRRGRIWVVTALSALVLSTGLLLAGTGDKVRVIATKGATVHLTADDASMSLETAKPGMVLDVVGGQGEFYRVVLSDRREGFVSKKLVEFEAAAVQAPRGPATPTVGQDAQPPIQLPPANGKVTVAVMPLDHSRIVPWWRWNWDVGQSTSEVIVDQFVENGHFKVLERQALDKVLREQDFSMSDRADPSAAKSAQIGKLAGAKYLVFGAVTEFFYKVHCWGVFEARYRQVDANVGVTLRLVDASTAAIVGSATGVGTRKHRSFDSGLFSQASCGPVSVVPPQYATSDMGLPMSEAARKAVEGLVRKAASTN